MIKIETQVLNFHNVLGQFGEAPNSQMIAGFIRLVDRNLSIAGDMIVQLIPPVVHEKGNVMQALGFLNKYHYVAMVATRSQICKLLQPFYEQYVYKTKNVIFDFEKLRYELFGM